MKKMNRIEIYTKILNIRTIFKRLTQLSWNISKLEERFRLDDLTDEELSILLDTYLSYSTEINLIKDELEGERRARLDKTP